LQITWTKFRSDLGQIWLWRSAQNRRRSSATLRILRLSHDQRWPEDEMQYVHVICEQALSVTKHLDESIRPSCPFTRDIQKTGQSKSHATEKQQKIGMLKKQPGATSWGSPPEHTFSGRQSRKIPTITD
jgi:hypothetical protein